MLNRFRFAVGVLVAAGTTAGPTTLAAQNSDAGATDRQIVARRAVVTPVIDGAVTDEEWQVSAVASDFVQYEPQRGAPSPVRTEAMVLYDSSHVYIAFRVFDDAPPAAQLTRRDANLLTDDAVIVLLDTYHDRRTAYYFVTNLLGTQSDGRIADDGRTIDDTWDARWQSASRATDDGWTAEFAIPLRSMRYRSGTAQTWGINFGRSRRRDLELSFWTGPLESQFRISQAGTVEGLDVPAPIKRAEVIAYGLSRVEQSASDDLEVGGDLRVAITPQISGLGTVNPDFATVEADQEQINLTRFELSLPEKRPFFLENAELFRQRIRTVYTRRIPDIVGGGQVTGRVGAMTVAGLAARSDGFDGAPTATYGVARLQQDVAERSNLALTFADRASAGSHEGSVAMDATLFFSSTLGMTAQLVKSFGVADGGTWGYFVRPSYDTPTQHFHVRYTHLGDAFADNVNAIGFIRDDDRRELDAAVEQTLWVRSAVLDRIRYDSNYNVYWSQRAVLRSWQIDQSVDVEFANRINVVASHREEFKRFESDFRNRQTTLRIGYNTREFEGIQGRISVGRNFGSDFTLVSTRVGRKLTEATSVEYEIQRFSLDPDPDDSSTWIHVFRVDQFFTPDLFLRGFFQTNSSIDRRNLQALFVYRYRPPFGTIQLAFQRGTAAFGTRSEQGNTLFVKATLVI